MILNVKNTFNHRMPYSNRISFVDCQLFLMDYSYVRQKKLHFACIAIKLTF